MSLEAHLPVVVAAAIITPAVVGFALDGILRRGKGGENEKCRDESGKAEIGGKSH